MTRTPVATWLINAHLLTRTAPTGRTLVYVCSVETQSPTDRINTPVLLTITTTHLVTQYETISGTMREINVRSGTARNHKMKPIKETTKDETGYV